MEAEAVLAQKKMKFTPDSVGTEIQEYKKLLAARAEAKKHEDLANFAKKLRQRFIDMIEATISKRTFEEYASDCDKNQPTFSLKYEEVVEQPLAKVKVELLLEEFNKLGIRYEYYVRLHDIKHGQVTFAIQPRLEFRTPPPDGEKLDPYSPDAVVDAIQEKVEHIRDTSDKEFSKQYTTEIESIRRYLLWDLEDGELRRKRSVELDRPIKLGDQEPRAIIMNRYGLDGSIFRACVEVVLREFNRDSTEWEYYLCDRVSLYGEVMMRKKGKGN